MLRQLDVIVTYLLLATIPLIILAYVLSTLMDRAGDHSCPLPDDWQTVVEDSMGDVSNN